MILYDFIWYAEFFFSFVQQYYESKFLIFFMVVSALKFLLSSSILIKSFVFESFNNVLLSMLMCSFIKDSSSQIFAFIACGNLILVCILITFASHDRNTILSGAYKTKTVLFSLIGFGFLTYFLAEKSINLANSIVTK